MRAQGPPIYIFGRGGWDGNGTRESKRVGKDRGEEGERRGGNKMRRNADDRRNAGAWIMGFERVLAP